MEAFSCPNSMVGSSPAASDIQCFKFAGMDINYFLDSLRSSLLHDTGMAHDS